MNRRLVISTAVVAGAGGLGAAWWRGDWGAGAGISDEATSSLWAQSFEKPEGGALALQGFRGSPLLLNFWATWCPPCLKEMPLLDAFHRAQRSSGWQVIGLAVDSPTPVRDYLARLPVGFPIGLAGMGGVELTQSLGNASGALPFTVVFDRSGKAAAKKLGTLTPADLAEWQRKWV